ncbi:MAG TPA: GNAT family N-acetyltransferase [Steroidobacteraceae bacterium]|nr:GNAT family N-acetyltransferase [Steroidobacteraceae bacterium]
MEVRELRAIDDVPAAEWNALQGAQCPFLRHEFLAALEHSGCVGRDTGWQPGHLTLHEGGRLLAAACVYRKSHSWGEFVFDFGWAQAYARHGLSYYPKLLCAVPFSPVNSRRLLVAAGKDEAALQTRLIHALTQRCADQQLSSAHATFIDPAEREAFAQAGWLLRSDVQFHWHNAGYRDFEHYLEDFRADKRKQMRRERRRIVEEGLIIQTLRGTQLSDEQLTFVYRTHARTFHAHGHEPYLNLAFFREVARTLGDALMVKLALRDAVPVAVAVFFVGPDALYGRYWGALGDFHSLHFELCYHQGIEFCIEQGLTRFEPGTQGEHKIARGFAPSHTWSAHYVADERFRVAIAEFLQQEGASVEAYAQSAADHVPFHRT